MVKKPLACGMGLLPLQRRHGRVKPLVREMGFLQDLAVTDA